VTDNLPQLFALQFFSRIPAKNALLMQAVCGSGAAVLSLGLLIEF
jgi:hypothetical protein